MDSFLILKPLLEKISDGKFFRTVFSWLFKISACLTVFLILSKSWNMWKNMPGNLPSRYLINALIIELFLLTAGFCIFNILWIRANDIHKLPAVKDYSVTPVVVITMKAFGEIGTSIIILSGLSLSLSSLMEVNSITGILPFNIPFLNASGNFAFVIGFIIGFLFLINSYFISEQVGALVDIARNTSKKR